MVNGGAFLALCDALRTLRGLLPQLGAEVLSHAEVRLVPTSSFSAQGVTKKRSLHQWRRC